MIINPEILVTPDCPTIQIREPIKNVDLSVLLPRTLRAQGWGIGTYFHVQFINHERTALLRSGLFIVATETEALQTNEDNPQQPNTRSVTTRKFRQIGDWLVLVDDAEKAEPEPASAPKPKTTKGEAKAA